MYKSPVVVVLVQNVAIARGKYEPVLANGAGLQTGRDTEVYSLDYCGSKLWSPSWNRSCPDYLHHDSITHQFRCYLLYSNCSPTSLSLSLIPNIACLYKMMTYLAPGDELSSGFYFQVAVWPAGLSDICQSSSRLCELWLTVWYVRIPWL